MLQFSFLTTTEEVEEEASMAETEMVDFGTTEVRIIETATPEFCDCDLTSFFPSDEDDGKGDEFPERLLFPFPVIQAAGDADLEYSGSTRQAVGVSKSILCLVSK